MGSLIRSLLAAWFAAWSGYVLLAMSPLEYTLGLDPRIYHRAAVAWVVGGDPWAAGVAIETGTYHFAGLPPTVLAFATLAWIPESIVRWGWVVASVAAAVWIVRRLGLPLWWLLFPPLVQGVLNGNPGVVLLALLLTRHPVLETIAAALKVYAVVPMLAQGRWRGIAAFAALCIVSAMAWPSLWLRWFQSSGDITGRLVMEAAGGASIGWMLASLVAVFVIAWLNWRDVGWIAIPGAWPSAQAHYAAMALPVIRPLPAALFAVPVPDMLAFGVVAHAGLLLWKRIYGSVTRNQSTYISNVEAPKTPLP